jgi:hypothetical protein
LFLFLLHFSLNLVVSVILFFKNVLSGYANTLGLITCLTTSPCLLFHSGLKYARHVPTQGPCDFSLHIFRSSYLMPHSLNYFRVFTQMSAFQWDQNWSLYYLKFSSP